MIALRRFGPLIALVLAGFGVVLARMAQVQLGEHEVWAREAAGLVRTSETLPYHRGRILDREGRVLVQDDDAYEVELCYRDFRREHPLGQVAHARAALELRPVSLHHAARELADWGLELVSLRPDELEAFAQGARLELRSLAIAATDEPAAEARAARAGELRFYVQHLLGATLGEWSRIRRRVDAGGGDLSHLELLAEERGRPASELAPELVDRWRASLGRLEQLAWLLALSGEDGAPPFSSEEALVRLIEALQRTRDGVEDAIASELFRIAAGFPAARIAPDLLLRCVDLSWIATALRWSPARVELWAAGLRESFRSNWDSLFVEAATIRALLGEEDGAGRRARSVVAPRRHDRGAGPRAPRRAGAGRAGVDPAAGRRGGGAALPALRRLGGCERARGARGPAPPAGLVRRGLGAALRGGALGVAAGSDARGAAAPAPRRAPRARARAARLRRARPRQPDGRARVAAQLRGRAARHALPRGLPRLRGAAHDAAARGGARRGGPGGDAGADRRRARVEPARGDPAARARAAARRAAAQDGAERGGRGRDARARRPALPQRRAARLERDRGPLRRVAARRERLPRARGPRGTRRQEPRGLLRAARERAPPDAQPLARPAGGGAAHAGAPGPAAGRVAARPRLVRAAGGRDRADHAAW